jgi:membrane associated rhomboid family serine protease
VSGAGAEVDASVCYRHPDRTSWTLCERCGRTICPECQILTPQGVRCPSCIEELGGSVQWTPAAGPRPKPVRAKRVRARSAALDDRPGWQRVVLGMLRPGEATPSLSWAIAIVSALVWVVGIFTSLVFVAIAVLPGAAPWELWRYVLSPLASFPGLSLSGVLSFVLNVLFFLLTAPTTELQWGRRRFAVIVLAAGIAGSAAAMITGSLGFGLYGVLFGLFGATLVIAWESPTMRTRLLISIGAYVLFTLILSPGLLAEVVGGIVGGTGAAYLLRRFDGPRERTAHLIVTGGLVGLVVIAVLRGLAFA